MEYLLKIPGKLTNNSRYGSFAPYALPLHDFLKSMIGDTITIEYFDQNERIKEFFPRSGKILKVLRSKDNSKSWLLVELEDPFIFGLPNDFGNPTLLNTHLLFSNRNSIDKFEDLEAHVHMALILNSRLVAEETIDCNNIEDVCWCIIKRKVM